MKSMKGYTRSSLLHVDAYIATLRILDVTDDTVTVQKAILAELHELPKKEKKMNVLGEEIQDDKKKNSSVSDGDESPLLELALSETGSKLFLMLMAKTEESRKKYFDPAELEVLRPNPTIQKGDEDVPTSKKSANTRRVELLQYMKNQFTACCLSHTKELLKSRCGAKVLKEVYATFPSKELTDAIVDACEEEEEAEEGDVHSEEMNLFEHPVGQLSIKQIILMDKQGDLNSDSKPNKHTLTEALHSKYKGVLLDDIGASNRGAFVLAAMAESDSSGNIRKELAKQKKVLKSRMKECKKMSKPSAGYENLLKAIE